MPLRPLVFLRGQVRKCVHNVAGSTALVLSLALCACGSAPAPQAESGLDKSQPATAAETPAQKCLAIAGVVREKKENEPLKIGARHVLVRYKGAKNAPDSVTRSREDACLRALEARDKMLGGADFDAIVTEYSEEAGAAERRGSVGTVERRDVAPPWADAAFELSIQQMSDVVETDFGFHLILRTE
ncbi:MAG: peptidylprolyl isomerase [Polyangiaceae bacterium]|nr:peptidylprolyl isomerase [Polyangiaceae bacterium]